MSVRRSTALLLLTAFGLMPFPRLEAGAGAEVGASAVAAPAERAGAQPPERQRLVVVITETPLLLLPDATREPLRVLEAGTVLRWLDEDTDWFHAEFEDFHYGRRVGYVQRKDAVAVDVRPES